MPPPLAYFLTWTTHGSWLHGDPRGSVDHRHNVKGTPYIPADPRRHSESVSRLRTRPFALDFDARRVVEQSTRDHCSHRVWPLHALNVRSNHVHVVLTSDGTPETAMSQLKAWATRRLREAGLADSRAKVWTEHGSTRWIDTERSLARAIDYVLNHQ